MAYTLNRRLAELIDSSGQLNTGKIPNAYISTDHFANNSITQGKLHSTFVLPSSALSGVNTDSVSEGSTNIYFTNARADARADTRIAAATTDDLSEGSSNLYYTDARADARVALIVDSAPGTLNTLNELAAALGDDANFSTTVTNSIATKLPLAGGTMTGTLAMGSNAITSTGTISSGAITSTGDITTGYAKTISMDYAPSSGDYHKGMSGLNQSSGTARGLHLFNYDADSNEGIKFWVGTNASRSQALHIASDTNATFAGTISSGAITSSGAVTTPSTNVQQFRLLQGTATAGGVFKERTITGAGVSNDVSIFAESITDGGEIHFMTGGSATKRVTIDSSGNVGIGTTEPIAKLHIQGSGSFNHTPGQNTTSDFIITSSEMADNNAHSIMQLVSVRQSLTTGSGSTGYLGFSTMDDSNGQGIRDAGRIAIVNEVGSSRNSATALSFWTNAGGTDTTAAVEKMRIDSDGDVGIGTSSMSSSYGKLTVAGTGISITPDTSAKMQIGRYNAANPYSYIKAGSTSSGFKFTNAADSLDLLTIDSSGMSVPLVTTNDIKATGAGGVSIQTDEGTKRIEVFDNGKITFNNLIYQSGINNNTINSGYSADSEDLDMWINYRGYNDGWTRTRDFRIGDGKGNAMAFFDGSEMTANIHTLRVNTGSFRAVGTLPSTGGMALTGVGLGQLSNYAHAQFSGSAGGYIDFSEPNVDWSGRIIYTHSNDQMAFYADGNLIGSMDEGEWIVRGGGNANQGKITFSTQSTAYNILGGNYWGYTGINSGGHIRLGSNNGEQMRLGAGVSTGNMALGLIGVTGVNSQAAIHGKSSDATLVLTNTDLAGASAWGWTGRGGRVLTSNGTNWTADGKDAALVIGSNIGTTQRGGGLGIVLHNESNVNSNFSPGLYFSTKSESSNYNTAYGYIMGRKTGSAQDTNWSAGEIHMDTAGSRTGTTSRTAYMDDKPSFKIDSAGDISMPYTSHAYGQWASSSFSVTNGTGFTMNVLRSQNMTYQNNAAHGYGMTVTKAGMYVLGATGLYDPGGTYIYVGWCINGTQIHHWHSNHAIANNHDYVSVIMRYLNIGDHITFENSSQVMSTAWGSSHSSWYMYKVG